VLCSALIGAFLFLGGNANAQSIDSFNKVTAIQGVFVTQTGLSYTIELDPGAFVIYNSTHYDIDHLFGFWVLGDNGGLGASVTGQNNWNADTQSSPNGEIAGWHNPNQSFAIFPGNQLTFTYNSLNQGNVSDFGFHASFVQGLPGGGNTTYIRGPLNPVPEPLSLVIMGLGAISLARLNRRGTAR
jgi:hypothetical protein